MNAWTAQDAKARFGEFLDLCLNEGPQAVSLRGTEVAVLVRIEEWEMLCSSAGHSIKSLLLSDEARTELVVPKRGSAKRGAPLAL